MKLEQAPIFSEKSIAVLPFVNMSPEPENEYFSDGITEEIINALAKIQGLKVTARTSAFAFKNQNIDIRIIGQQLGVTSILEGSVRSYRNRLRITAQLIRTEDGFHLWSETFDRVMEDIFDLQDEISLLIADQIRENFGHMNIEDHLIQAPTNSLEAYNLYLKGRYNHLKWNSEGIQLGIEYYKKSIALDPDFALPHFGIGYSYAMSASFGTQPEALQAADDYLQKGFQLDDQSYMGYFGKATYHFWGKWDFIRGHRFFKKAMALNPSYTEAEEGLAELFTAIGDFDNALHHAENILRINPLSPNHFFTKANIHYLTGDFDEAMKCLDAALHIDPLFIHAIGLKQLCYIQQKKYKKLSTFLETHPQTERPKECRALYQLVHPDENIDIDLEEVRSSIREDKVVTIFPWQLFLLVHMGHHDLALDLLQSAVEKHTGQYINFMNIPLLAPLHSNERFKKLIRTSFAPSLLPQKEDDPSLPEDSGKSLLDQSEIQLLLKKLEQSMKEEQLFSNPTLNLRDLATHLQTSANKLSWLLNEQVGSNFNEYLNSLRLEAFKQKALDPANEHLTLLGLAFESGFNSKTVFNSFFKKMEGQTPRAWLKSQQK
jgi:adenylate cyclase